VEVQIYKCLPNFHTIQNATYEAFATGQMGDQGIDYAFLNALLNVGSQFPKQGVMVEVEEDIFSVENGHVVLDKGNTPYKAEALTKWDAFRIHNVPAFELHHGLDIQKKGASMPIQLNNLTSLTTSEGFNVGGWFVFAKKDVWAYRCNEFYYGNYTDARNLLEKQATKLKDILSKLIPNKEEVTALTYSLEKVHVMFAI